MPFLPLLFPLLLSTAFAKNSAADIISQCHELCEISVQDGGLTYSKDHSSESMQKVFCDTFIYTAPAPVSYNSCNVGWRGANHPNIAPHVCKAGCTQEALHPNWMAQARNGICGRPYLWGPCVKAFRASIAHYAGPASKFAKTLTDEARKEAKRSAEKRNALKDAQAALKAAQAAAVAAADALAEEEMAKVSADQAEAARLEAAGAAAAESEAMKKMAAEAASHAAEQQELTKVKAARDASQKAMRGAAAKAAEEALA